MNPLPQTDASGVLSEPRPAENAVTPLDDSSFLKGLLEASVDGIMAFDRECRFTAWNRAMECISGLRREEVLGKRAFDVFPFMEETGEFRYFLETLAGKSIVGENRPFAVPQTGRAGFFEGFYSPLKNHLGEIVGGVGVVRDITERKRVEEDAREVHQRLTFHVENTPLAVVEWDSEFRVSRWAASAERLFGWKQNEVIGKRVADWDFVFPDDLEAVFEVGYRQRQAKERHGVSRNRNYTKNGDVLYCEWYNSTLYDENGKLVSILSLVLDVTAAKRVEHALRESEEQYRLLFESNPHAMWVYDLETLRFLAVNDFAVDHYGYSREEFLSMTIRDIRPAEDIEALNAHLASPQAGLDRAGEWRHRKKDGSIINVEITSHRFDFGGRPAEFVLANDITERKRAEIALRESEDRYRDLVENSHELMCTHDLKGRIISVNPWASHILGYPQHVIIGKNIRDNLTPEFRAEFDTYLETIMANGFARGIMRIQTASGDIRLWEYYNTLRTEGVETPIVRGMAHDVTERRQALAREKEARLEAEAANRIKDEFLSTLSHELRTPLTAIIGWSKLLIQGDVDPAKQPVALETIVRNAQAQGQLINDLLEVSRIITGKLHLNFTPCQLQPIVEAAIESVRPTAEAKGVKLKALFEPRVGLVSGDADRLQQVVWNLLSNAVKFTRNGGLVEVRFQRSNSHVEIVVRDSGEGIRSDFLPHVFERFRQADGSTTRAHGGLGLGLAIVRHLVELHGGSVNAASAGEGKGATFTVKLPLLMADEQMVGDAQPRPIAGLESLRLDPSSLLMAWRILVVDDEADARELISTMLASCGAIVETAASTSEALEVIPKFKPRVLIADIGMQDEDGYALIKKLRSMPESQGGKIPAVALTAYARIEDRQRALASGFQLHLAKPVDRNQLAMAVSGLAPNDNKRQSLTSASFD
jgi:PAS domain S-box-containing protein